MVYKKYEQNAYKYDYFVRYYMEELDEINKTISDFQLRLSSMSTEITLRMASLDRMVNHLS